MSFKLSQEYKVINLIGSTTVTADLNGTGVDLELYENDALAILNTGVITSTTATFVVNIQGSTAVSGTYTTLASFNVFNGTAFSYKVGAIPVSIEGSAYKYVRAQVDVTAGDTTSAVIGVNLLVKPTTAEDGINSATIA
jgi:hypothetical protein